MVARLHCATTRPATAPAAAMSALSTKNWRASLQRPAPIAARIATSPRLADARARNRLATFAQAIRNTKPAAARRTMSGRVALPTIFSFSGIILRVGGRGIFGLAVFVRLRTASSSA